MVSLATTPVILAVWPMSVRSTSVKVTGMEAVSAAVFVCSLKLVATMALMVGASFVPVAVTVTFWVVVPPWPSPMVTVKTSLAV